VLTFYGNRDIINYKTKGRW